MKIQNFTFSFEEYQSIDELNPSDTILLTEARNVTRNAYAPYSRFRVGAFAQLTNGKTLSGSNQENASFPLGLCAERVLLTTAASLFPEVAIGTIAISYNNENGQSSRPISPCGLCRQSLVEYESRVNHPIRIILSGLEGKVLIIERAALLLPLSFSAEDLAM